jgi:hypothetical protein
MPFPVKFKGLNAWRSMVTKLVIRLPPKSLEGVSFALK